MGSNDFLLTRRAVVAVGLCAVGMPMAGLLGCSSGRDGQTANGSPVRPAKVQPKKSKVDLLLAKMTTEQKVAQLFVVSPEQLTGIGTAVSAGETTRKALAAHPVGGLCYFGKNITDKEQLTSMLANTLPYGAQAGVGIKPFLTVDEEGGSLVARVANSGVFDVEKFPDMADIGASGDTSTAEHVGSTIGTCLRQIGFNVDFAPVADVLTNPANTVIGKRAFSSDPAVCAEMVAAEVESMLKTGTLPCVKHFPGHGDTAGDSHTGAVRAMRTREQIEACEFVPFKAGIEADCPMVMVGHIETPNFAADGLPASLSKVMMTDILRGELGFSGLIISDLFAMGAITDNYEPADAAVRFFAAGGDVLLMPEDFSATYTGVVKAVKAGGLRLEQIDASVKRVLKIKESAGLLPKTVA